MTFTLCLAFFCASIVGLIAALLGLQDRLECERFWRAYGSSPFNRPIATTGHDLPAAEIRADHKKVA